jgi:hypothetical protein
MLDLDAIRIASPCPASWDAMRGDARVRHCDECKKNVYDLAGLSRAEAETLLRAGEGEGICMRVARRADGRVVTGDCPVGARAARSRLARTAGRAASLLLLALASAATGGCDRRSTGILRDSPLRGKPVIGRLLEWLDPAPPRVYQGKVAMGLVALPLTPAQIAARKAARDALAKAEADALAKAEAEHCAAEETASRR